MSRTDVDCDAKPVAKKLAKATGAQNYNLLQNNGRLAHQVVDHVSLFLSSTDMYGLSIILTIP